MSETSRAPEGALSEHPCKMHPTAGIGGPPDQQGCVACSAEVRSVTDTAMRDGSPAKRAEALRVLLEKPWYLTLRPVWEQVDRLVGRGTMTHELAFPDALEAEILSGEQPTDVEIVMKLKNAMGDKPVVVINPETGEGYTV